MPRFLLCLMFFVAVFALSGCASHIHVAPYSPVGSESSSVELGKTYTVKNNEETVLVNKTNYITIIRSDKFSKLDVDTVFKDQYPGVRMGARFQIVGLTDEGNYVGWTLDGYRPKPIEQSGSSSVVSSLFGAAVKYASNRAINNMSARTNSAGMPGPVGVGSKLSPEMLGKVNNAAMVSTGSVGTGIAGGQLGKIVAGTSGTVSTLDKTNSIVGTINQVNTNVAKADRVLGQAPVVTGPVPSGNNAQYAGAGATGRLAHKATAGSNGEAGALFSSDIPFDDSSDIVSVVNGAYGFRDTIMFFDKDTLKPYALRSFVDRTVMDRERNHIFHKILNDEGAFSLSKSCFNVTKCVLAYKGVANNVASFQYRKYVGSLDKPAAAEIIEVDLSKNKAVAVDGFKFEVVFADSDKADISIKGQQM
jgi:hypothetical protein